MKNKTSTGNTPRRAQKKRKRFPVSVRNFLIVLIGLFSVFAASDILLLSSESSAERRLGNMDWAEGSRIIYMNYEKTPLADMLTSADLKKNLDRIPGIESIGSSAYPLIDLPTGTDYDDDTVNIVVLGDSFVWGEGAVNRNELFWRQLELILRGKGYNCRVYAVGMAGATAYEELSWLTETSLPADLAPDIAIFGYVYNDALIDGETYEEVEEINYDEKLAFLAPLRKLLPVTYYRLVNYIDAKTMYNKKYGDKYTGSYISLLEGSLREYYETNFAAKLDAFCRDTGIPAAVVTLPNETKSEMLKALYAPLREIFADTCVNYYDSLPEFGKRCSGAAHKTNIKVNPLNNHPGSASNHFYAEYISEVLTRDYADVLGAPQNGAPAAPKLIFNEWMPGEIDLTQLPSDGGSAVYSLKYPDPAQTHLFYSFDITPYALNYPIGEDYVKLSFAEPTDLSSVRIEGEGIEKLSVYFTRTNPKLNYDDHTVYAFGDGDEGVFRNELTQAVTSLCVHAEFSPGADRTMTVTVCKF